MRPNRIVVSNAAPAANPKTGTLMAINSGRWISSGLSVNMRRMAHCATRRPSAAPTRDSTSASEHNWATMPPRVAPRARRTPISRYRSAVRARVRLARFAQAISRRNPTAAISTYKARCTAGLVSSTENGNIAVCQPSSNWPWDFSRRLAIPAISARACASVTPGFRRAGTFSARSRSSSSPFQRRESGSHTSASTWSSPSSVEGRWNLGGNTPTMV